MSVVLALLSSGGGLPLQVFIGPYPFNPPPKTVIVYLQASEKEEPKEKRGASLPSASRPRQEKEPPLNLKRAAQKRSGERLRARLRAMRREFMPLMPTPMWAWPQPAPWAPAAPFFGFMFTPGMLIFSLDCL